MVQARLGNTMDALEAFRKVAGLQPGSAEAHLNLGIVLADSYDLDGAFHEFTEAGRLAPESAAVHYNKGRALLDQRRYPEARDELEAACRLAPNFAESQFMLAMVEKNLGEPEKAVPHLQIALKLEPRNADAWYLLGRNLQDSGKPKEAVEAWKRALEVDPEQPQSLFNLLRALRTVDAEQSKHYEARFVALKQKQQLLTEAETLGNFALSSAKEHDWPQAVSQLQEAIRLCGDCRAIADLHKDLGLISCQSGDLKTGERELRTALALKPGDADIQKALATAERVRQQQPR
jgi:tetratricopeptide (TPR) repeat protein